MQFFVLSALAAIFVSVKAAKSKSINVALDTVLEFDKSSDVEFIDRVQEVLSKVKHIIKDNSNENFKKPKGHAEVYKFTDLCEDLIQTLLSFDDKDLKEIVEIVAREIGKSQNPPNENIRRYLTSQVESLTAKEIRQIRKDLDKILRKTKKAAKDNSLLRFINDLYKRDAQQQLAKIIRKLKIFRRRFPQREALQHIIRKALHFIIFEQFHNLSKDAKRKVQETINYFVGEDSSKKYDSKKQKDKKGSELALQKSGDINIFQEKIDTKEVRIKSKTDYSEETETLTKPFAVNKIPKNKLKMNSAEKSTELESREVSKEGNIKESYNAVSTLQIKHKKPAKYNNLINIRKKQRRRKTYSKQKLTHITLYPENMKIENKNIIAHFRATIPVVLKREKSVKNYKTFKDLTMTSLTQSGYINVNRTNNLQYAVEDMKDNLRKDQLNKVKTFRQKFMERSTTGDYKDLNHSENMNINSKHFGIQKTTEEYFGNLFKNHRDSDTGQSDARKNADHSHRINLFLDQIERKYDSSDIEKIHNIDEKSNYVSKNKFENKRKNSQISTYNIIDANKNKHDERHFKDIKRKPEFISKKNYKTYHKYLGWATERNDIRQKEPYNVNHNIDKKFKTENMTFENYILNDRRYLQENKSNKKSETIEHTMNISNDTFSKENNFSTFITNEIASDSYVYDVSNKRRYSYTKGPNINDHLNFTTQSEFNNKQTISNNMESTTKTVFDIHKTDAIDNKINRQLFNKSLKLPVNNVTIMKNVYKISRYTINNLENFTNAKQSDFKKKRSNFTRDLKLKDLRRNYNLHTKVTTNVNKGLRLKTNYTKRIISDITSESLNRGTETNLNPELITESYNNVKPNYDKIMLNDKKQQNTNVKATTLGPVTDEKIDAELQINNEIDSVLFDINKDPHDKEKLQNTSKLNDDRRQINPKPKVTAILNNDNKIDIQLKSTETVTIPIDIKQFFKNLEITDIDDAQKKKEIEEKMKEELGNMFTSPVTEATTTAAYTDIFEAMDNEFGLGPLL